jgi:hypothetical protein
VSTVSKDKRIVLNNTQVDDNPPITAMANRQT